MFVSICVAAFAVCVELAAVSAEAAGEQPEALKLEINERANGNASKRTFALRERPRSFLSATSGLRTRSVR